VIAALLEGCAPVSATPAAKHEGEARRMPDGVAIDLMSGEPPARDHADAREALVTLRAPLGKDRAILVVRELFEKVALEDGEGLEALFTRDAIAVTATNAGPGQLPAATNWLRTRFNKLDYTRLAGETIFREADLGIYSAEDALEAPPHPAIRREALGEGDVVIRAPIVTSRVGADRLLGDEVILWLRREADRYRIYRIYEDFQIN
jgi:hypothetical protein